LTPHPFSIHAYTVLVGVTSGHVHGTVVVALTVGWSAGAHAILFSFPLAGATGPPPILIIGHGRWRAGRVVVAVGQVGGLVVEEVLVMQRRWWLAVVRVRVLTRGLAGVY